MVGKTIKKRLFQSSLSRTKKRQRKWRSKITVSNRARAIWISELEATLAAAHPPSNARVTHLLRILDEHDITSQHYHNIHRICWILDNIRLFELPDDPAVYTDPLTPIKHQTLSIQLQRIEETASHITPHDRTWLYIRMLLKLKLHDLQHKPDHLLMPYMHSLENQFNNHINPAQPTFLMGKVEVGGGRGGRGCV